MAYMNRGDFSSFNRNLERGIKPNDNEHRYNERMDYGNDFIRINYYVPLDNTYVIFQMIVAIIIFATAGITILVTYKPSVVDPIEKIKSVLINTYIIIILMLAGLMLLVNHISKDKNILIKRLTIILLISTIMILIFSVIKIRMNSTYTKNKFEQIYTQEYNDENLDSKNKSYVELDEMQIKTQKEHYVDEWVKAYNMFGARMYGIIGINILLIFLLIYQISRLSKIQEKKDKLKKDDIILFDNEENVKF